MAEKEKKWAGNLFDLPETEMHPGITRRTVFGPERFWNDYVARLFTLEKGASVSPHRHDWPHYIIVLSGRGKACVDGKTLELQPLGWATVAPGQEHHFEQTGEEPLSFVCIVPTRGDVPPSALKDQDR